MAGAANEMMANPATTIPSARRAGCTHALPPGSGRSPGGGGRLDPRVAHPRRYRQGLPYTPGHSSRALVPACTVCFRNGARSRAWQVDDVVAQGNAISPQHSLADTGPMVQPPDRRAEAGCSGDAVVLAVTADDDRYAAARVEATRIAAEQARAPGDDPVRLRCCDGPRRPSPEQLVRRRMCGGRPQRARRGRTRGGWSVADRSAGCAGAEAGVPTTAWLPSKPGPEPLNDYAREHGVSTIVVPSDLEAAGELERLATAGADAAKDVREQAYARVVLVPSGEAG